MGLHSVGGSESGGRRPQDYNWPVTVADHPSNRIINTVGFQGNAGIQVSSTDYLTFEFMDHTSDGYYAKLHRYDPVADSWSTPDSAYFVQYASNHGITDILEMPGGWYYAVGNYTTGSSGSSKFWGVRYVDGALTDFITSAEYSSLSGSDFLTTDTIMTEIIEIDTNTYMLVSWKKGYNTNPNYVDGYIKLTIFNHDVTTGYFEEVASDTYTPYTTGTSESRSARFRNPVVQFIDDTNGRIFFANDKTISWVDDKLYEIDFTYSNTSVVFPTDTTSFIDHGELGNNTSTQPQGISMWYRESDTNDVLLYLTQDVPWVEQVYTGGQAQDLLYTTSIRIRPTDTLSANFADKHTQYPLFHQSTATNSGVFMGVATTSHSHALHSRFSKGVSVYPKLSDYGIDGAHITGATMQTQIPDVDVETLSWIGMFNDSIMLHEKRDPSSGVSRILVCDPIYGDE